MTGRSIKTNMGYAKPHSKMFSILVSLCVVINIINGEDPQVKVTEGLLEGTIQQTDGGRSIFAFYKIPYARPPVGSNRFLEPSSPVPWEGVRAAKEPGPKCLQYIPQSFSTTGMEDCLYLNIFTPKINTNGTELLPVIVYFHNDDYDTANADNTQPTFLLDKDVILVIVNSRLGILGYFSTGDNEVPGNNGLKDQVASLEWIQANIINFGGNKSSVTIAGSTGGGVSVNYHYLSNLSKGLFARGIISSGSVLVPWSTASNLQQKGKYVASSLSCPTSDSKAMVDCLRTFYPQQLVIFTQNFKPILNTPFAAFGPCVEPETSQTPFLNATPYDLIQSGMGLNLPTLFSNVNAEGLYPLRGIIDDTEFLDFLDRRWNEVTPFLLNFEASVSEDQQAVVAQKIRRAYFGNDTVSVATVKNLVQMFSDRQYLCDTGRAALFQAANNSAPVYFYYFKYENAEDIHGLGVGNGGDIAYILHEDGSPISNNKTDVQMRQIMTNIWASFALDGVPNVNSVTWSPVYNDTTILNYLEINSPEDIKETTNANYGNKSFWDSGLISEPGKGRF